MTMSETSTAVRTIAQMLPGAFFAAHRNETAAAMLRVLDSGWYILGQEVKCFEDEFAEHFAFSAAVGVASGTDALVLALRALNIGPGDRVATVSHTAVATVAAIEIAGALPVFVDIEAESYTMDPAALSRTLQSCEGIKAVIAVHLYGHPADMPAITSIARQHGLFLIEDCSQAHGATLHGHAVGSMGDIATFSFYPTKNLGAMGDGGMVVTGDKALAERVRVLREYGWQRRYVSEAAGMNSRLDELQAAMLRIRLPFLDAGNRRRAAIAAQYDDQLADIGLTLPTSAAGATHVYHQFVVRHPERDSLRQRLLAKGIGTNVHYPLPVHLQPAYASRCAMDPAGLVITEAMASCVISLPMYPELSDNDTAAVVGAVRESV